MTPDMALARLNSFAAGLSSEGFDKQAEWVRTFRVDLMTMLREEEVIDAA